ncbi:MAG: carboxypeptidase-like regulatory domain-containing protein [Candidatus Poribacteria bacterium]|nr:carboxypeptidase-like regulatory domain-containing protein [Candidatus Poribacteria bacterium]
MTRFSFVLIVTAWVGMFTGIALAQDNAINGGTIRGMITDTTPEQNPIEGVEVKIVAQDGTEHTTKTDANGDYKKAGIPAGRYTISIHKEGYNDRRGKPVTIVNGGDHFVPLKMTEKGNIGLSSKTQGVNLDPNLDKQIESLLARVGESIGKRYNLNEAATKSLRQSIYNSNKIVLTQNESLRAFAKALEGGNIALLEFFLSHPHTKAIFAKHLTETQLQEYLKLNQNRWQLYQQAIARQIVVMLDRELSLTTDQRQKIEQLLLDTKDSDTFPNSMIIMLNSLNAAHLVHYKLKLSLDEILSQTQSKIWHGLVSADLEELHEIAAPIPEVVIKGAVDAGKVQEKEADAILEQLNKQTADKGNTPESQERIEQMRQLMEAKLAAHTELLQPLDERASRHLRVAAKGIVQQYLEIHGKTPEATKPETDAKPKQAGEITPKEAAEKLKTLREGVDITDHPLYQQAIKDVLSEDAFKLYRAHQTERDNLRQQVLRDRLVALIDNQLLLDETQRNHLETVAAQVTLPSSNEEAVMALFMQFSQQTDLKILSSWQRREFGQLFGPPVEKE